jgi:hypothetical protein
LVGSQETGYGGNDHLTIVPVILERGSRQFFKFSDRRRDLPRLCSMSQHQGWLGISAVPLRLRHMGMLCELQAISQKAFYRWFHAL